VIAVPGRRCAWWGRGNKHSDETTAVDNTCKSRQAPPQFLSKTTSVRFPAEGSVWSVDKLVGWWVELGTRINLLYCDLRRGRLSVL
jgi:hypothetical protein